MHLTGSVDATVREDLRAQLAGMLEGQGAHAPVIEVRLTGELRRGATGKAPLIVSRLVRVRP